MRLRILAGLLVLLSGCTVFDDYDDQPWIQGGYAPSVPQASAAPCGCGSSAPPGYVSTTGLSSPPNVTPIPPAGQQSREPDMLRR